MSLTYKHNTILRPKYVETEDYCVGLFGWEAVTEIEISRSSSSHYQHDTSGNPFETLHTFLMLTQGISAVVVGTERRISWIWNYCFLQLTTNNISSFRLARIMPLFPSTGTLLFCKLIWKLVTSNHPSIPYLHLLFVSNRLINNLLIHVVMSVLRGKHYIGVSFAGVRFNMIRRLQTIMAKLSRGWR